MLPTDYAVCAYGQKSTYSHNAYMFGCAFQVCISVPKAYRCLCAGILMSFKIAIDFI